MGTAGNDSRSLRRLSLTNCSHCVGHDVNLLKFRKFQLLFFECLRVVNGLIDAGSNRLYIDISLPATTACVLRIENHEWDAFLLTPKESSWPFGKIGCFGISEDYMRRTLAWFPWVNQQW